MSLWISVDVYDESRTSRTLDLGEGGQLMGFESFRHELWGTPIMESLGLKLLPSLGGGAYLILNSSEQIDQLEWEAIAIRDNIDAIREALGEGMVYSIQRTYLRNLFHALEVARANNGEISIG